MKVTNSTDFKSVARKSKMALKVFGVTASAKLEAEAKVSAKWIDRTSNARNSLNGQFRWEGNVALITLSGGMDYSVYLELAMEKRYAVIVPTIQKNHSSIISNYGKVLYGL